MPGEKLDLWVSLNHHCVDPADLSQRPCARNITMNKLRVERADPGGLGVAILLWLITQMKSEVQWGILQGVGGSRE